MHPISNDYLVEFFYEWFMFLLLFFAGNVECVFLCCPACDVDLGGNWLFTWASPHWAKLSVTLSLVVSKTAGGFFLFDFLGFMNSSGILLMMYLNREVGISDSSSIWLCWRVEKSLGALLLRVLLNRELAVIAEVFRSTFSSTTSTTWFFEEGLKAKLGNFSTVCF